MFPYIALVLAQVGTSGKQFSMKICGRRAPGNFNSICINLLRAAICLVVSLGIWLFSGGMVSGFWGHVVIIVAGIGTALNLFTWILASRVISLTLLECFMMLGTMVLPMIIGPSLYPGETVTPFQWIGCALIFVSVFLFMNKSTGSTQEGSLLGRIVTVAVCVIGITFSVIFKKLYQFYFVAMGDGSVEYFTFLNFVTVLLFFLLFFAIYYLRERRRRALEAPEGTAPAAVELPYRKVGVFILIAAASLYLNELFTVYASELDSAIYYPLAKALTIGCSFLMDVFAFHEKVTLKKLLGLVVVIAAIVLVNI